MTIRRCPSRGSLQAASAAEAPGALRGRAERVVERSQRVGIRDWPDLRLLRGVVALLIAFGLSSCQLLGSKKEDFAIYGVELTAAPGNGTPVGWQLVVDEPIAADPTSGSRIVLKPEDRAYGVYKGARWTDRAPHLVQALVIEAFESSNRIVGLGRSSSSVRGDFLLMTELRAFEARFEGSGASAHVEISAKLVNAARNEVVAAKVFEATAPAAGRDVASVVPAFEVALNEAVAELVAWTFDAGNAHASATP